MRDSIYLPSCAKVFLDACRKLVMYPKGDSRAKGESLSLFLELLDCKSLSTERKVYAEYKLRIKDQILHKHWEMEGEILLLSVQMIDLLVYLNVFCFMKRVVISQTFYLFFSPVLIFGQSKLGSVHQAKAGALLTFCLKEISMTQKRAS